jgi:hypothetical protein
VAGPSVMVRILGDVSALAKSLGDTAAHGESAAGRMHTAFSGALDTLNQTGVLGPFGQTLDTVDSSLSKVSGHGKEIGTTFMGVGAAAAGVGVALEAIGSKDKAAHQQLQAAVEATGASYAKYSGRVDEAVKHQEHFGTTADETQTSLRVLTQATNSPTEALKLLNTATDLAAAKHESLSSAAEQLGKAYNGSGKVMKEFGITVSAAATPQKELETATKAVTKADTESQNAKRALAEMEAEDATKKHLTALEAMKLQDAQARVTKTTGDAVAAHASLSKAQQDVATHTSANTKALDELGKKLSGQASASANTFTGHLNAIKATVTDHVSLFAQKYGPAITTAGVAMTGLGAAMEVTKGAISAGKAAMAGIQGATKAWTIAQALLNVVMDANPIMLIVIAIAVLVAAFILAYKHVTIFRDAVDDMGKIAKAAFETVVHAAEAAFGWISGHWPLLLAILTGPFGLAIYEIARHFQEIVGFAEKLPGEIVRGIGDVGSLLLSAGEDLMHGFIKGVENVAKDVVGAVTKPLQDAVNAGKKVLSILSPSRVFYEMGQQTAQGFVLGMGAVDVASAGSDMASSAISGATSGAAPAPAAGAAAAGGPGGPAVVIHNAVFGSDLDVDALMKRVAWHVGMASV